MKAHRSLRREDVLKYPSGHIAFMVASEFWRAADLASHSENVRSCFERAQELLGILETIMLPDEVASDLKPLYYSCQTSVLKEIIQQEPQEIKKICEDYAQRFDMFGKRLGSGI